MLATDKTGTLTEGRMVAERVWTARTTAELTGRGYAPDGRVLVDGRPLDDGSAPDIRELLTVASLCNDATLVPPGTDPEWSALGDPTEAALLAAAGKVGIDRAEDAEQGMSLLGLIAISHPPREAARAVATRPGILRDGDTTVLTGVDLSNDPERDPTTARVFARTTPEQKLTIIQAWQSRGDVTAMTGDGVDDGPALRRADIGVATGGRGTEVARQAADPVLADDEIGTVVVAVEEGRRVYDNIRRFLVYGLSGGAAEIAVMMLGPLLGLPLPLLAAQILWINLLTHGLTGVALGAEPAGPGTMRRATRCRHGPANPAAHPRKPVPADHGPRLRRSGPGRGVRAHAAGPAEHARPPGHRPPDPARGRRSRLPRRPRRPMDRGARPCLRPRPVWPLPVGPFGPSPDMG
ncbi:HAD-IC family P-type ATPase [Embleya sp. MST-111070]|uniref:HAD-IC family P-type ATPase n=1 Tax=Embleya sp. MST-111070 TaxID=3398231 RepID=UPI003F73B96D